MIGIRCGNVTGKVNDDLVRFPYIPAIGQSGASRRGRACQTGSALENDYEALCIEIWFCLHKVIGLHGRLHLTVSCDDI